VTAAVLAVLARGVPGRLAEFRRWYDQVHIPELRTRYPEILEVERHDVARSSRTGPRGRGGPDSVAIYLVDGSAADLWSRMSRDRSLTRSDAIDYRSVRAVGGSD
jgi:hypothetical protein